LVVGMNELANGLGRDLENGCQFADLFSFTRLGSLCSFGAKD